MNIVYFNFVFINTIKRKPIWITWLLFLFTCTCFIIILPLAAEMNTLQVWANTTMAVCQTFMGMVASLFTAILAINIFKDSNEEGTELIIISKPISRTKIVLTKFFVFGAYCLLINLTTVLLSAFTIFLPKTEPYFYGGLLISMFIGNLVTFAVFGSISILLTVKFAKMGVIITNIIISLIFLIYQALTLFVFSTPAQALDQKSMSAPSYIVVNRNTETGEYKEQEVVKFEPTEVAVGRQHPCQASTWQEMEAFWKDKIQAVDPTPILNATDFAGQIGLTYMSFKTDEFAARQANRMFAISRFYNYELTSPASPEIVNDPDIETKQDLQWIYYGFKDLTEFGLNIHIPSAFGFAGIEPLTGTRLRGYANKIPVASIRSKKLLFSTEVFYEPEDWIKYAEGFEEIYNGITVYTKYDTNQLPVEERDDPIYWGKAFGVGSNLATYYDLIWQYLTGHQGGHQQEYYDITNVNDLNHRFMQFKNFAYWKALDEQKKALTIEPTGDELTAKNAVKSNVATALAPLAVTLTDAGWFMANEDNILSLLVPHTQAPCLDWFIQAWANQSSSYTEQEKKEEAVKTAFYTLNKTAQIFKTITAADEDWLYSSLDNSKRASDFTGRPYVVTDNWYPYLSGILKKFLKIDMPLGQNVQYFFYKSTPMVNYWIYAVIWGTISAALFAAGTVVYFKYDVK
ncbi:MAG: ABC transporter permease [Mycoplasmoidaceae bacterium]